jgi:hypothetical protein
MPQTSNPLQTVYIRRIAYLWLIYLVQNSTFPAEAVKGFLFSIAPRPALGSTQPPIQRLPGVKWPRDEAEHSPPPDAEIKNP